MWVTLFIVKVSGNYYTHLVKAKNQIKVVKLVNREVV
jgi:hypothetical protein